MSIKVNDRKKITSDWKENYEKLVLKNDAFNLMENFPLKSKDSLTQQCQLQVKVIIHSLTREKTL